MKNKTIAIYSGEIPSTTFIERLIVGLAFSGNTIYLFGAQNKSVKYPKTINKFTYSNRFNKFTSLLKYIILLSIFKADEKRKLDEIIAKQKGNKKIKQIKYYPVLYHKPDIFHLQWAKGIEDWLWVKEFGIKFVISLRGTHISISPIADDALCEKYKNNFHKVDGFHAVSKAILEQAKSYAANLKNAEVIYSGLDLEKLIYKPKASINSKLKVLSIGRSHWVKGYNYALDALAVLDGQKFQFQYTIVGINKEEELIFQQNQLNLIDKVTFLNQLPFNDVLKLIKEADVLLLPSVEEGIANVVIEAMALGTLVISTDSGGMKEVVQDGENGFVVPVRNAQGIAGALMKASKLTVMDYNVMTQKARTVIEQKHSNEKMVDDFNAFYERFFDNNEILIKQIN
jgi:glycosyltransferase involved in cell wall biosynthesis